MVTAERIGILGGTFDPPHAGHVAAALAARRALGLDRVLLVVANYPYQKVPTRDVTGAEDRFALVEAAVEGLEGIEASRIEIDRGGPSYTVETVEHLLEEARTGGRPPPEVFLVVGADLVPTLDTWERVEDLRRLVTLVVVSRPHSPSPPGPEGWRSVAIDGGGVDVSSSQLRGLLTSGRPPGPAVADPVIRCIRRRGLYAVRR